MLVGIEILEISSPWQQVRVLPQRRSNWCTGVVSLLLGSSGGLGGFLGLLLSLAQVLGVGSELSELSEDLHVSLLLGDLLRSNVELSSGLGEDVLGGVLLGRVGGGDLVGGGVVDLSLLGLVSASWEQNQLALVTLKSLGVKLESLLGDGVASVVDGDADGLGEGGAQLGLSQLSEGEASSVS